MPSPALAEAVAALRAQARREDGRAWWSPQAAYNGARLRQLASRLEREDAPE